jgi:hypothetical protein
MASMRSWLGPQVGKARHPRGLQDHPLENPEEFPEKYRMPKVDLKKFEQTKPLN